jgi:hypothetical protein
MSSGQSRKHGRSRARADQARHAKDDSEPQRDIAEIPACRKSGKCLIVTGGNEAVCAMPVNGIERPPAFRR